MAMVYCLPRKLTPKAFSTGKHGEKFPIFSCFFFLVFLSREQDNAYRRCRRRGCCDFAVCRDYDAVANESAADAVCSYALSTSQAGICKNSLLHAISRATGEMRAQIHKYEYQFARF